MTVVKDVFSVCIVIVILKEIFSLVFVKVLLFSLCGSIVLFTRIFPLDFHYLIKITTNILPSIHTLFYFGAGVPFFLVLF